MHFRHFLFLTGLCIGVFSCGKIIAPDDTTPPAVPLNFILIGGGDGQAHFRWSKNNEPDFDKYFIYRSVENPDDFEKIAETREQEFLDRFLNYDLVYYYKISAVDYAGNESNTTEVIDIRPVNISSPPSPTNLMVYGHNLPNMNQIEFALSWTPPNISDLWKFLIYRSTQPQFITDASTLLDSTAVSIYYDRSVQIGDRYYYRVQSIDFGLKTSVPSQTDGDIILQSAQLTSPANRIEFSSPYQFTWREVENAIAYQVFVGRALLTDVIWTSAKTKEKQIVYSGTALRSGQIYYWWVVAYSKDEFLNSENIKVTPDINSRSEIRAFFVK